MQIINMSIKWSSPPLPHHLPIINAFSDADITMMEDDLNVLKVSLRAARAHMPA
jgi:hypothetical protein